MYNLTPVLKSDLEPSVFSFFMHNLRWFSSPAKLDDGTATFDSMTILKIFWATRNVYFVQNVTYSRLEISSSTEVGMPTVSRHSLLLYSFWVCILLSSDMIRFKRLSFTVLVAMRDNSNWSSVLDKISTVLDKVSKRLQNFSISFSRSFCKCRTKTIRFSFFKSLSVFSVRAICVW